MELFEAIRSRRSVRDFDSKPVPDEILTQLIEAARWAPTGGNLQPWEFVIVKSQTQKERLVQATYAGYMAKTGKPQSWILKAPVVVVACANLGESEARYGDHGKDIAILDLAACIENFLLAAVAVGLGSCWVSGYDEARVREILRLPNSVKPIGILPVGYPKMIPPPPPRLPVEDIVYYEEYMRNPVEASTS
ncbi:MAG TPA: nitroreductase family protein [Firmicutes bacterium]|nr:nitroreductase family protein [Bacillota bacterium]